MHTSPDTILAGLFPKEVSTCFSAELPHEAELMVAETVDTNAMVEKRLREFTHGRHCAHQALLRLGAEAAAIPKAADRSPVWPAGIIGSISHSGPVAAAAVARSAALTGLGLDIETAQVLPADVIQMVCRPDEMPVDNAEAKLYFCFKEAVYKCIYPLIEMYVDFQEMEVAIDQQSGSFTATAHSDRFDAAVVKNLQGKYAMTDELIFAAAWIMQTD
jgi:4'-phosphopantetheinyl transferase EntD